jgi:hypothetical protein
MKYLFLAFILGACAKQIPQPPAPKVITKKCTCDPVPVIKTDSGARVTN